MTSKASSRAQDRAPFLAQIQETYRTSGALWTASLLLDRAGLGALGLWPKRRLSEARLRRQAAAILRAWGMSEDHALITVRHLLYADAHGIDSHGCGMLLAYYRGLTSGALTMSPEISVVRETETTALLDGGGGLGHVPADRAMRLAIEKARRHGLAAVAVRNSGHFGAAGCYARMAADEGLIGIAMTNTAEPAVVPTFGVEAKLGTNPIAISAPAAKNEPFLLDMATSTVPLGKLWTAWRDGKSIPPGWALNRHGDPETNPRKAALGRRLTPLGSTREMGGHKGYGLAAAVEILCSVLPGLTRGVGHFFVAMDPAGFAEESGFETALDTFIDSLRETKPKRKEQPVMVAGDPENAAAREYRGSGIPLPRMVVEDIRAICRASDVPFLLDGEDGGSET